LTWVIDSVVACRPEAKERFARLREAVALIKQLWTEDRLTFEGDYDSFAHPARPAR
jgi:alkanesulfonate monooxygenase SsuD/methylene tetrahydromethanopterin reductase-like flavin-dependent oxidoreductase (luciferase family)